MPTEAKPKVVIELRQAWVSSTCRQWRACVNIGWHELCSETRYTPEADMREQFDELASVLEALGFDVEVKDA